jgi:protein SCO1/2
LNGIGPTLGSDFTLLTVSIDAHDAPADAALIKARGLRGYNRPGGANGWHVLTSDQKTLDALSQAVGFQAVHDPQAGDFAHPIGAITVTPQGTISQYLEGIEFDSRQLQAALTGATQPPTLGTLLVCYHFDPLTGQYTQLALNVLRVGGAVTVVALAAFILKLARST